MAVGTLDRNNMSNTVYQGDTWPFTVGSIKDFEEQPVSDVALWGCEWAVDSAGVDILTKSTEAGSILRDGAKFTFRVTPAESAAIAAGRYRLRTSITSPTGDKKTFLDTITVNPVRQTS
jgi:hypothetical protein